LIPVTVGSIRSLKDGSVSVTVETQELSPGKAGELFALRNKMCYAYFSAKQIDNNERQLIDSLDPEIKGKTPGQRLRAVMYRLWEQQPEGYADSESFYKAKMENIINTYKSNLQP
jgi:hypothetical protein